MLRWRFLRPASTLALIVVATLLLAPSVLVNWTRSQVYNEDRFADSAVVALQEEVVRDALVRAIVNEIVEVGSPEIVSLRPLIEFVTATVVESLAFQEIFRESVAQLHGEVLGGRDRGEPVSLTVVDAVVVVTAYIQQAYPELAGQLPPNLDSAFIEIRSRDWAVEAVTFGERVTALAIVLPVITALLYAVAIALSRNRRQTLLMAAIGWVAAAVLLVVGRDFAREAVLGAGFPDQAVSEAIWDVYTRSMVAWAALLGGGGMLLAVAATGAHRADPGRQFERVRRAIAYTPVSPGLKVLRAGAFIVAGLLVVVQRDQVLDLAILSAAAYLVYYGLSELVWLAGGAPVTGTRTVSLPGMRDLVWRRSLALRAAAVVALLAVSAGGYFLASRAVDTAGGEVVQRPLVTACNGHRELCDRRLNHVVFLGTHNSMAAASERGWYFANQLTGIRAQLEAGVRVLLIDTYYGYDTGRGVRTANRDFVAEALVPGGATEQVVESARRLAATIGTVQPGDPLGTYLCHAYCELGATPLTQTLSVINNFLVRNPGEVLFIAIQDHITPEDTAKAFIASGLVQHVYTPVIGQPLPTLRELIELDQRVIVMADTNASGIDWYLQSYDLVQDTPFRVVTESEFSCDYGRGDPDAPLFAMNHWLTQSFPSSFDAGRINTFGFIYDRVVRCHQERQRKVNLIIVNFFEIGDAGRVVDYLNGVGGRPGPEE